MKALPNWQPLTDYLPVARPVFHPKVMVTEEEYWKDYYNHETINYEWNNGLLEEKPVSDYLNFLMYDWFVNQLLAEFLRATGIAKKVGLEMGFRLALATKTTIRKPDLGVVRNDNPVPLLGLDRSYHGIFDLCIEALSDSSAKELKRDTITKFREYAAAGVKEYYLLYAKGDPMGFYRLTATGMYAPIPVNAEGLIRSVVLPGFQFRVSDLYQQPSLEEMSEDPVYQAFVSRSLQQAKQQVRLETQARQAETQARKLAEKQAAMAEKQVAMEKQARQAETQARTLAEKQVAMEKQARTLAEKQVAMETQARQAAETEVARLRSLLKINQKD